MSNYLKTNEIVKDLLIWRKIRVNNGRSIGILYTLDVSEEILKDSKKRDFLMKKMSIENRATIQDPYITEKESYKVSNDDFCGTRFLLLGAPGELSDSQIKTLKSSFLSKEQEERLRAENLKKIRKNSRFKK